MNYSFNHKNLETFKWHALNCMFGMKALGRGVVVRTQALCVRDTDMYSVLLLLLANEITLGLTCGRILSVFRVSKGPFLCLLRSIKITLGGKAIPAEGA